MRNGLAALFDSYSTNHRIVAALRCVLLLPLLLTLDQAVLAEQSTAPTGPTFAPFVAGLLARTRYVTELSGHRRVELWDLLVGPGRHSAAAEFPGAVVLEVREGSGRIRINDKGQELTPGTTLSIPAGSRIEIENTRQDLGLLIRATIIQSAAS